MGGQTNGNGVPSKSYIEYRKKRGESKNKKNISRILENLILNLLLQLILFCLILKRK